MRKSAAKKSTFVIIGGKLLFYAKEGKFVFVSVLRSHFHPHKKKDLMAFLLVDIFLVWSEWQRKDFVQIERSKLINVRISELNT